MLNRRSLIAATLVLSPLAGGIAMAQNQPVVGIQTVTTYSSEGRITAVDPNARTVTVTFPNGATRTHQVSPAVANFSATRIGDTVTVGFEDQLTFVLSNPGTPTPGDRDRRGAAAVASGQSVTGVGAAQTVANWWIVGVDAAAGTLTLVDPDSGPVRTYKVTTQAGRDQLPRVKVGDSLTAINTQVLVISITPKV
jgi:hypothetical protein